MALSQDEIKNFVNFFSVVFKKFSSTIYFAIERISTSDEEMDAYFSYIKSATVLIEEHNIPSFYA